MINAEYFIFYLFVLLGFLFEYELIWNISYSILIHIKIFNINSSTFIEKKKITKVNNNN